MRRFVRLSLLCSCLQVCLLLVLAAPAHAERRVALVIGNGAYKAGPLKNPVNDARDMAASLKGLGFEVILRENAGLAQMEQAVDQFWISLKKGGVGLFFFAGHGLQVKGVNYLVPVDVNIQVEQDVKVRCLDVNLVLGRMEDAGNPLNLVILDACRNNPFARAWRNAGQGLAKMDAPAGTLIAYATAPDSVAADGAGKNGVYTSHLLRFMHTPGLTIENVLKQTRVAVLNETSRKQIPWESSSLTGDFYFSGPGKGAAAPQPLAQPAPAAPAPPPELALGATSKAPPASLRPGEIWTEPVTGMEFVWVPGGEYEMGCGPWAEGTGSFMGACYPDERPVHTVRVKGFWMARHAVTQGQWRHVMGANPSFFQKGEQYPVENVSWHAAKDFIAQLNARGGVRFRLPTEAEWEYAARSGGKPEKFAGGSDLDRVAWHEDNSGGATHPVGLKAPNGLGLYDMCGNVMQWCEDAKVAYSQEAQDNPVGAGSGSRRSLRGGAWYSEMAGIRIAYRHSAPPDAGNSGKTGSGLGLRLVREP